MIESQNIRQILAIMVTDIVDYTETMNNDEAKAWEYLKKQRRRKEKESVGAPSTSYNKACDL